MSDEQDKNVIERRPSLPKPDVNNITVLTKNLPNEPVLPWHRFDSPWLNRERNSDETSPEADSEAVDSEAEAEDDTAQQLTLEFSEASEVPEASEMTEEASQEKSDK